MKISHHKKSRECKDIQLFNRFADSYNRKDLLPASRMARRLRLQQTLAFAPISQETTLLELGCGAGWSVDYLGGNFARYLGIDYSESLIGAAQETHQSDCVAFEVGNIKALNYPSSFDVVFMIGVLHHVDDMATAMEQAVLSLRPGGWLLVNEPQPGNPFFQAARLLRKRLDSAYSEDQITLSRRELRALFENSSLEDVKTVPQGYLSTPFAEARFPLQSIAIPLSRLACWLDRILERHLPSAPAWSWNLIACGRKPWK